MGIINSFKAKGHQHGGVLAFSPEIALSIVSRLEEAGVDVLGIDGFKIGQDSIQPFMEHSINFEYSEENWSRARKFLQEKKDLGLVFEIVARGE